MIKAQHTKIGDFIFRNYLTFLFRKHFYKIHLLGDIPQFDTSLPLILLPNHSTWWDGFFIYFLNKTILKRQAYLMMLEEQLAKNLFFKYIGAYSIDSASPSQIKESITYTLSLIDRNVDLATMVCIFPQGELLPWGARPLGYKRGVELVLKKINRSVNLCPLAIKSEFLTQQRPEVFFLFGKNRIIESNTTFSIHDLESDTEHLLDSLSAKITSMESGSILFRGRSSVNEAYGRI